MDIRLVRLRRFVFLPALFAFATSASGAAPRDSYLERALAVVESDHAGLCPSMLSQEQFKATIDRVADEIRAELASRPPGPASVEILNRSVFTRMGMRGSSDLKDPCNLLPLSVLGRKQGYCVGIATLYLMLAERLGVPIYAVATPSHVFLRYDDGTARVNIETLQSGANIADEQYVREQKIPEGSIRRGIFLRNLSVDEFLAQVHNNLGVVYSERKEHDRAALEYEAALDLDPRLAAASYNYANDLLRAGEYRRALRLFSKSLHLYPTDVWALNNRGLAYLKMGKAERARRDFEDALRIDPAFEQARRNLKDASDRSESP